MASRWLIIVVASIFLSLGLVLAAEPPAAKPSSPERIEELIRKLGDKDYFTRQQAQEELGRLGFEAFEALNAASTHEDFEIASRARYLLRLMRAEWISAGDSAKVKECLQNYEALNVPQRQLRMQVLAGLPDGEGVEALCRLVRFEKSSALSKQAALALLNADDPAPPGEAVVKIIREKLQNCTRPGAIWLLAWTRLGENPQAALEEWEKLVAEEQRVFQQTPPESGPEIVSAMIRFQVAWLNKLGRGEQAAEAIRRLVSLEKGGAESLAELLDWLIEQKAWQAIDELAQRFPPQFAADPELLYTLAQVYAEQGKKDQAAQAAERALQLNPGKQPEQLFRHLQAAESLRDRGRHDWSCREYEYVIAQCGEEHAELMVYASSYLANLLHDQGEHLAAAAALKRVVEAVDAGKAKEFVRDANINLIRCQMHYFTACHWAEQNDLPKQREALDKALEVSPRDVDVLIACHKLPDQPPEFRAKIAKLIEETTDEFRGAIAENPDSAPAYNQFAWLVGNTDGDLDEALKCSLRSVELAPREGGFFDTLAHVYFAKGEYEKAVETQKKAVKLDPHSGVLQRKLKVFSDKLKETREKENRPK